MKEISIHGRGGQGSLVLAQFMAIAALEDGKYGQAFPFLGGGGERRGKPIMAFCRLSDKPIRLRSRVSKADYVILQDVTILGEVDVAAGIETGGHAPGKHRQECRRSGAERGFQGFYLFSRRIGAEDFGPSHHEHGAPGRLCGHDRGTESGSDTQGGSEQISREPWRKKRSGRGAKLSDAARRVKNGINDRSGGQGRDVPGV